ncbi:MocR-like pyridoxine biosynthesis transcription factor PdxR [Anaeromyxobacter paludicola]|uniref:GntR family transcriptional regulator n=1 Tax=Anaeromyxobacter paludicola TaxID=2918171 RepID=A0ABN6N9S7_9BACT|nr:PLP-dependent aminotransferase family protein [Anaeromyxobacter paludicola]BDG09136.1 GntR family transcriptional regulator [Anaeromyxobacter paludicola]
MRRFETALALDRDDPTPVFLQIARAIAARIRSGALPGGAPLPSSRALAATLRVHRNTVLAAYAELAAEGWLRTRAARGTFVTDALPARPPARFAPPPAGPARAAGFPLPPAPAPLPADEAVSRASYLLLGGTPDPRLVPSAALARAYRRALRRRDGLSYGDPRGHPRLRAALASMLASTRGIAAGADGLVVTRGSQGALALVARALLRPGDAVAVEALGYHMAWETFRLAGLRLVPVPVDAEGLDVGALSARARAEGVRAVYLTPHHHYPTTVTLAPGRRLALLDLARRERLLVIEDDYDAEFHYEGRPVLPLASADPAGVVAYVGTLSKVLAPGLRVGWVAAPPDAIERLARHRAYLDRQGDHAVEAAVAELFEDGELQRHLWRTRRILLGRRDALADRLGAAFGERLRFRRPPGGMALWCEVAGGVDPEAWARAALARGVAIQPGRQFALDGRPRPCVRLGFGRHDERELAEAVRRLARALRQVGAPGERPRAGRRSRAVSTPGCRPTAPAPPR